MPQTRFLSRDQLWQEIRDRLGSAKRVVAAVSYLGKDGAELLPLRRGDTLVVDLSLGAVKQGVTDPREIQKLIRRGVQIFTRASLHAKVIVIDGVVIASSANVSQNARHYLDEAGILSDSPTAAKDAKSFIKSLCSEPVRDRYLKECLAAYQPPKFKAARTVRRATGSKRRAKLWFIGGLKYIDAARDQEKIDELTYQAEQEIKDPNRNEVTWIRLGFCFRFYREIRRNDWVIDCVRANASRHDVGPPVQVIRKSKYTTKSGKTWYMLMLEFPTGGESMTTPEFRRAWADVAATEGEAPKRSRPVMNEECADRLMMKWTPRGRKRKQK